MVRNYARLLKLEPEAMLERMAPRVAPATHSAELASRFKQPMPFSDSGRRSTLIYAGFSVGVLLLVALVAYTWQYERAAPEFVAPAQQQRPEPETTRVQEPPAVVAKTEPQPEAEKPKLAAEKPKPAAEKPKPEPETPKPQVEPEKPKPAPAGSQRLVFHLEKEAWIEVRDGAGRLLVSSLNAAGTERVVNGRPPFELVIGNASGVTLTRNGKPVDLKPYTKVEVARFTLK